MDKKEADLAYHKSMLVCHQRILHEIDAVIKSTEATIDELEKQEEPQPRFYNGQPVLMCGDRAFYIKANTNYPHEHRVKLASGNICSSNDCKPDLAFKSIPNWIEWKGGECPVDSDTMVAVELRGGDTLYKEAKNIRWDKLGVSGRACNEDFDIIRYAVIDLPEWCDEG